MSSNHALVNRRTFIGALAGAPAAFPAPAVAKRPNIVIIMADDMGFSDIGCYGSEIATPNLDRLAAHGVRFTQFYNTARCCPTRSSLLTGLYSHQAGIGHMVEDRGHPAYQGYLNDRCATIAEALAPAGYRNLMAGKWHVGSEHPNWPVDRGFHRYYGIVNGGSNYFRLTPGRRLALDNSPCTPPGENFYLTDAFTDYALKFMDEAASRQDPFFLYLAYTAPHWPLHALPSDIAKYRGNYRMGWDELRLRRHRRMIEMGIVDKRWPLTPRDPQSPAWGNVPDQDMFDLRMAVYAAQIDRMDQNIGRVLETLREKRIEDNTLVLFLSDNGGCAEEVNRGAPGALPGTPDSFTSYGRPWANASNTPFRLYKHWVHEGGISTPLIARWPAVIKRHGTLTPQPGHVIDLMATCLDVAGAQYPGNVTPLEGKSLVPVFQGKRRKPHDAIFWEHEGNRAVRQGKWKLVSRHPDAWELYDLEADRTEMNDLSKRHPGKVNDLRARYDAWAARCSVQPWDKIRKRRAEAPRPVPG
jgi:arylsulfatase